MSRPAIALILPRNTPKEFRRFPARVRGFALISVLAVLALLVVLVVSIATVLHVETRSSASSKNLLIARQNALLGLDTAISQLQQYAGKDQAITFPATTAYPAPTNSLVPDKSANATSSDSIWKIYRDAANATDDNGAFFTYPNTWLNRLTERPLFESAVKAWWANRNPHWVGIMDSSLRRDAVTVGKFGEPKRDQIPVWLVSGNERFLVDQEAGTVLDADGNDAASDYSTPGRVLPDPAPGNAVVYLVGPGSAADATASTDGLDGRVKVEKQEIKAPDSEGGEIVTGHYAYWVGDESTKANFAVRDRTSTSDTTYPGDVPIASDTYRSRLQVPQRVGWENLSGFSTPASNGAFLPNDPRLENINTSEEIGLVSDDANQLAVQTAAKNGFHCLTAFSKSLLTDASLGGLKKDLSASLYGSGGPSDSDPIADPARYVPTDPRLGSGGGVGFPASTASLPTWGQIRDWKNNDSSGTGIAVKKGFAPILANYQLHFAFTHKNGKVQFHMLPVVALWNPYDAPLDSTAYTLRWRHNFALTKFGVATAHPAYVDPTPEVDDDKGWDASNDADGRKQGSYFIGPLAPFGWHASKNYGIQFATTFWASSGSGNLTVYHPNYQFSPFDWSSSNTAGVMDPRLSTGSAKPTWVNYTFSTGFEPGEVKVFSVGTSQEIANPEDLHNETASVQLENVFDPDYPSSYYFDVIDGLSKGPIGTPPAATDDVRFYATLNPGRTPGFASMELRNASEVLWTNFFTGAPGNWDPAITGPYGAGFPPNTPAGWRTLYHLDDWNTVKKPGFLDAASNPPYTSLSASSPIVGMWRGRVAPLQFPAYDSFRSGAISQEALRTGGRAFGVMNLAASSLDPILELELSRAKDSGGNPDKFLTRNLMVAEMGDNGMPWNDRQTTLAGSSTRGYGLVSWKEITSLNNLALSTIPVRQVKRATSTLLSIGQLQQANLSRYSWQPAFPVGNSEASPYVDRDRMAGLEAYQVGAGSIGLQMWLPSLRSSSQTFPNDAANRFVDLSYLLNENLWDSCFFSSIPQTGALSLDNSAPLPNGRMRFNPDSAPTLSSVRDFEIASAHLFNWGAFNVNSTSVEAWKSLLTSFRNLQLQGASETNPTNPASVPIVRTLSPIGDKVDFTFSSSETQPADFGGTSSGQKDYSKVLNGFRYLTDPMIQSLAERIVDEVRLRGPFLSLSDFVNRRLVAPDGAGTAGSDWQTARTANGLPSSGTPSSVGQTSLVGGDYDPFLGLTGLNGALQRAINVSGINGGMNYPLADNPEDRVYWVDRNLSDGVGLDASAAKPVMSIYGAARFYLDTEHMAGSPAGEAGQFLSHTSGLVSQGDILAMIGPALTARGDTFLVRTYGDSVDKNGKVLARCYLEAVVQRLPEPVTPAGTSGPSQWVPTDDLGRRFKIVKLRWLNPQEV